MGGSKVTDKFEDSLKSLIQSFVDQGYTEEQATKLVNEMFATFGRKV